MKFTEFWESLERIERSIMIQKPRSMRVRSAFWGGPSSHVLDLPVALNAITEPQRTLGFGGREQSSRLQIQLLVAPTLTGDDAMLNHIATAFWFAAKDVFDKDPTLGGVVDFSTLRGGEPTVPVLLRHAGNVYIGFSAILDIKHVGAFEFGGA